MGGDVPANSSHGGVGGTAEESSGDVHDGVMDLLARNDRRKGA